MNPLDSKNRASSAPGQAEFAFGKENYRILLAGILILILGYALMVGGGSEDPEVFNEEIFSFRRITLAPIVVLIGYGVLFYAIMKKSTGQGDKG